MPMERDRYPQDWDQIAFALKEAAGWICQECKRPCRKPGEKFKAFKKRLSRKWKPQLVEKLADFKSAGVLKKRQQRFLLTVAHLDQRPSNGAPENLRALCAPCHLRHDRRFIVANRMRKRERQGQLSLFDLQPEGSHPNAEH